MKTNDKKTNEGIESLIARAMAADTDLTFLAEAERDLKAESERLSAVLSGMDVKAVSSVGKDADPKVSKVVFDLQTVNTKLGLVPGMKENATKSKAAVIAELYAAVTQEVTDCRRQCDEAVEDLERKEAKRLAPICGNDPARTKKCVQVIVDNSEMAKWWACFRGLRPNSDAPAKQARFVLNLIAGFKAGKPCTEAYTSAQQVGEAA